MRRVTTRGRREKREALGGGGRVADEVAAVRGRQVPLLGRAR